MPECEAAHFWAGWEVEPHILLGAPWAEKIFEASSSEGLHTPAGVHVSVWFSWFFNRPLWQLEKSRSRGGRRMGLVCSAGRQHNTHLSFKVLKGSWWHSSYRCCSYQLAKGDFCSSLCAGHLAVPADLSGIVLVLLVVERGLSSVPGEHCGVSERPAQLPPSPLRGGLQETVPCLLLTLLAVIQVRLFIWKNLICSSDWNSIRFFSLLVHSQREIKIKMIVRWNLADQVAIFVILCQWKSGISIWFASYYGFTTMREEFVQAAIIFWNCL